MSFARLGEGEGADAQAPPDSERGESAGRCWPKRKGINKRKEKGNVCVLVVVGQQPRWKRKKGRKEKEKKKGEKEKERRFSLTKK
jgi:hypothetical protein